MFQKNRAAAEKDGARLEIVTQAVDLALRMRAAGVSRTGYAKMLREVIFFAWETAEHSKYDPARPRSAAAQGLPPAELDYDHAIPMKIVIDLALKAGPDADAVEGVLREKVHAVLITKEEHARLRDLKLGNEMPVDWDGIDWRARYRAAGITLPEM